MVEDYMKVFERQCEQLAERLKVKLKSMLSVPEEKNTVGQSIADKAFRNSNTMNAQMPSGDSLVDYEAAWALLHPDKSSNPAALRAILKKDGLTSAQELRYAEKMICSVWRNT
jgi:hypothetical protein